jgi:hypothetical protein
MKYKTSLTFSQQPSVWFHFELVQSYSNSQNLLLYDFYYYYSPIYTYLPLQVTYFLGFLPNLCTNSLVPCACYTFAYFAGHLNDNKPILHFMNFIPVQCFFLHPCILT